MHLSLPSTCSRLTWRSGLRTLDLPIKPNMEDTGMVFAATLAKYLIDGMSEAIAKADEPVPLTADRHVALSASKK